MTAKQAQSLSRLDARENPEAKYDYLRCQLGESETVLVQTSAYRSVKAQVFKLVAFGSSWENAVAMWEKKRKQPV